MLGRRWTLGRHRPLVLGVTLGLVTGIAATAAVLNPWAAQTELEPGALVVLSGHDDSEGGQRQALINGWNATHPDNPVRIIELSSRADAQRSEMVARAQRGDPEIDVYNLDVTWIAEFASFGYLQPLGSTVDVSGFLAGPLDTCRYDGQLWALPFNSDAGLLFYRADLISTPPASWSQLVDQVRRLLGTGQPGASGRPEAGFIGQLADYEGGTVNAVEAIMAAHGSVIDSAGRITIDSEPARDGLRQLADGLAPASPPQLIHRESLTYDETSSARAFAEGKAMFMRNWPVAYRRPQSSAGSAANADPPAASPGGARVEVTLLPWGSVLGGQNLAIARATRRPRAARALIEYLTDARSQQILFERGGFAATRQIVYEDAAVQRRYPYAKVLLDAIHRAKPRPKLPHYALFSEVFREVVKETLARHGTLPPDAVRRLTDAKEGYRH